MDHLIIPLHIVRDQRFSNVEKMIYCYLADNEETYMPLKDLASYFSMSLASVKRATKNLREAGLIVGTRKGKGNPNTYEVLPWK